MSSVILGAVGMFWTIRSGLTKVERDRLNWLEAEYPRVLQASQDKDRRIGELNAELFEALRIANRRNRPEPA